MEGVAITNDEIQITNQSKSTNDKKVYDLVERTSKFGGDIIDFVKTLVRDNVNNRLIDQIVRSATSIGANYMEADGAESKKDFIHKISICKKESKETEHWLKMLAKANENRIEECRKLWKEVHELTLIFSSIINKSKYNK
ncbi:MAG: four helix bundle protein [Candidatus Magasanikbacteria bacterium CG_4_10_14_0_2_um_filter_33_14]|uniref:Four helix bundle protein n=1 Tax=Candidatus Magasanikbacteria bacterium CG_4_10_14_0_2_um_filter_33_14 TaxID=1974636 RepID=A0A2M7VBX8_9BACT|nr:MAG: four helix bundle protein [Candidatus Magasanikbacteria bacterium CG_4_10_14_0_2_um_filter_33_14]